MRGVGAVFEAARQASERIHELVWILRQRLQSAVGEQRLCNCVVKAAPDPALRLLEAVSGKGRPKGVRGVLASVIRVHRRHRARTATEAVVDCDASSICLAVCRRGTDQAGRPRRVHPCCITAKVAGALLRVDPCSVTGPHTAGTLPSEYPSHRIRTPIGVLAQERGPAELSAPVPGDAHLAHQPSDVAPARAAQPAAHASAAGDVQQTAHPHHE